MSASIKEVNLKNYTIISVKINDLQNNKFGLVRNSIGANPF